MVKVGILALQGGFLEHAEILRELGVEVMYVKRQSDLNNVDALIIPGGEPTSIGSLLVYRRLAEPVAKLAERGTPIMGICAGAVLLAKRVVDRVVSGAGQFTLGLMDIGVARNIYGRQKNSFVAEINIEGIGTVKAAFIRAPGIVEAWGSARIVSYLEHPSVGKVGVAAVQNNILALTFHPEITGEKKIYQYLLARIAK